MQVSTPRGPTIDGEQHSFEVISPHLRRQTQTLQHPLLGVLPSGGQGFELLAEMGQAHKQANAVVVNEAFAPKRVEPLAALGLPVGLVLVKVGCTTLADLVRDGLPPRQACVALGVVV